MPGKLLPQRAAYDRRHNDGYVEDEIKDLEGRAASDVVAAIE